MSERSGAALSLAQVGVQFSGRREPALVDVQLAISPGEHVAILGSSGSGKTTLLRVVLGAVAHVGTISVGGLDPALSSDRDEIRRHCGVLRQGSDLVPVLTARTNAVMGCSHLLSFADWTSVVMGRTPRSLSERLNALAERHGIVECLDLPVHTLSGGQRQRVALLRAVLGEPRLLIADEPTSGLDPVTADQAVRELRSAADGTVLVTTHDLDVARAFPRVIGLRQGRVVHDAASIDAAGATALYGSSTW